MTSLTVVVLLLLTTTAAVNAGHANNEYCAALSYQSEEVGWAAVAIDDGYALYKYKLDFGGVLGALTAQCGTLDGGLAWHIHSFWTDGQCGKASTGNHYDPNLACGPNSQYSDTLCPSLGRTSGQGYTYGCSPANYAAGDYGACEVGDLSGKFGKAVVAADGASESRTFVDFQPPYAVNYQQNTGTSAGWASLIFHCPNGTRAMCAELVPYSSSTPCPHLSPAAALVALPSLLLLVAAVLAVLLF